MGRFAMALGLAFLAACGEGEAMMMGSGVGPGTSSKKLHLTLTNAGTEVAHGDASDWYESIKYSFTLNPGASVTFDFPNATYRVRAHVWRSSDSLLILDDWWEGGDLEPGLTVTLSP